MRNASYNPANLSEADQSAAKLIFGEKVRSLMNNQAMNQSDLARAAGLKRDAVSTYIRGKVWPDPQNLRKLSNALRVTPGELIPGMSEITDARTLAVTPGFRNPHPDQHPQHHCDNGGKPASFSMEEVAPGCFRLRFERVLELAPAMEILAIINRQPPDV